MQHPRTAYREAPADKFLTIVEVARELRISRRTAERRVADGTLHSVRVGRLVRVPASELDRLRAEAS